MTKSKEFTIGIAAALGVLLANLFDPWASAVLAAAALLWLLARTPKGEVRNVLRIALVTLVTAAVVVLLFE